MLKFAPSRSSGLARLYDFLPKSGKAYAEGRNYDLGPGNHDSVSCLSPWIRCRSITEEEVVRQVLSEHSQQAAEKFIQEVCWRTYWKGWLAQRPIVWKLYESELNRARDTFTLNGNYLKAVAGNTKFASFNSWVHELIDTGYLHNHARMWFSSIWIHTLRLPWTLGAAFFLKHLLDGDCATNTLSWRWVAGLQTLGKTYSATNQNIEKYTHGRLGKGERYEPAEVSKESLHAHPEPINLVPLPIPAVVGRVGLLVTEDDVRSWEVFEDPKAFASIAGALPSEIYAKHEIEANVIEFRRQLLEEALQSHPSRYLFMGADVAKNIQEWASKMHLECVYLAEPAIGFWSEELPRIKQALSQNGVDLVLFRRPWDDAFYPHAKKGFFNLKKQIPNIVCQYA